MSEIAVLDACVLVPYNLCSVLLTLAEEDLFEPRWSDQILKETSRALVEKLGRSESTVERRIEATRTAFPEATVQGYQRTRQISPVTERIGTYWLLPLRATPPSS